MCRREQLRGVLMLGGGLGLLLGCWMESSFWQICFGICLLGCGVLTMVKK